MFWGHLHPALTGVMLVEVVPRSPADKAGLKGGHTRAQVGNKIMVVGGDVIVKFNGEPVSEADDMIRRLRKLHPGDHVRLDVANWDGGRSTVTITLGERPRQSRNR